MIVNSEKVCSECRREFKDIQQKVLNKFDISIKKLADR